MSEQICVTGCGKPTQNVLLLCQTCLWAVQCDLEDVGKTMMQADVTLGRRAVMGTQNGGRSSEHPILLHAGMYEAKLTLETQLVGWVRDLAERHGEEDNLPGPDMASIAQWLLDRAHRIATHPAAAEIHDEITTSMAEIRRLIDRPADQEFVGVCDVEGCPGWLYANIGASSVGCRECGTAHPVAESRDRLMDALSDRLMTKREIAGLAMHYGLERGRVMKLMDSWIDRGRLIAVSKDAMGEPRYPFGSTLVMLRNTPTRKRTAA